MHKYNVNRLKVYSLNILCLVNWYRITAKLFPIHLLSWWWCLWPAIVLTVFLKWSCWLCKVIVFCVTSVSMCSVLLGEEQCRNRPELQAEDCTAAAGPGIDRASHHEGSTHRQIRVYPGDQVSCYARYVCVRDVPRPPYCVSRHHLQDFTPMQTCF